MLSATLILSQVAKRIVTITLTMDFLWVNSSQLKRVTVRTDVSTQLTYNVAARSLALSVSMVEPAMHKCLRHFAAVPLDSLERHAQPL